jgi:uncharacterized protein YndB with AHSA1/START domain
MNAHTIIPAAIRKTLVVKASPQKAFSVFTEGFDRWWPKAHTVGETPLATAVIEPRLGGRWYGRSQAGVEDVWGDVLAWEPPTRLLLAWRINGEFKCKPSVHTEVEVRSTDLGDGSTRVDFEHRDLQNLGANAEKARESMDGGWAGILAAFKTVVEG